MKSSASRIAAATMYIALVCAVCGDLPAKAQTTAPSTPGVNTATKTTAVPPPNGGGKWMFFGSERLRVEDYNWFPTDKANGAYTFTGSVLRAGVKRSTSREDVYVELEMPALLNLPTKATAAAPQGALGQGANYFSQNGGQVADVFPKQAYIRFKKVGAPGASIKVGRFEFSDGAEIAAADPTLSWLKTNRIAARLIGPFNFTHVGRAFDGVQLESSTQKSDMTLVAAFPTRGVFDLDGWDTLTRVPFGYISSTSEQPGKRAAGESRWFALYYGDTRAGAVKVDNRPLATRAGDHAQIDLLTFGGDYLRTSQVGPSKVDGLIWAAGQSGKWGALQQAAYSYDAEAGWQFLKSAWKPWLRGGYYYASGSGSASSGLHATFNPILPTPRLYARYPFYTESNIKDLFGSLVLQPCKKLSVRSDIHALRLASPKDLWYSGGGAFDNSVFGYAGRPSNGHTGLGTLLDISADYQARKSTTLSLYLAYVNGGDVEKSIYKSGDSVYVYTELTYKF